MRAQSLDEPELGSAETGCRYSLFFWGFWRVLSPESFFVYAHGWWLIRSNTCTYIVRQVKFPRCSSSRAPSKWHQLHPDRLSSEKRKNPCVSVTLQLFDVLIQTLLPSANVSGWFWGCFSVQITWNTCENKLVTPFFPHHGFCFFFNMLHKCRRGRVWNVLAPCQNSWICRYAEWFGTMPFPIFASC